MPCPAIQLSLSDPVGIEISWALRGMSLSSSGKHSTRSHTLIQAQPIITLHLLTELTNCCFTVMTEGRGGSPQSLFWI